MTTWQPLSQQKPRAGQAVLYRLRPGGVEVPAIYEPKQAAWVLEDGPHQTARPHHQWIPDPAIENRSCLACGKPLTRKMHSGRREIERMFRARNTCDQQCNGRLKRTVTAPDTKTCQRCGRTFTRRRTDGHAQFLKRKYCSISCAAATSSARPRKERQATPRQATKPQVAPAPKREIPKPPPAPQRQPQAPVKEWSETTKRSPVRGEFDPDSKPASTPGPDPRAHRHETVRMRTLGEPCPHHPTEKVNAWGKRPACTTGNQWAERQRQTTFKPHPEGGR